MAGDLYLRVQLGLPKSDGAMILKRRLEDERAWAYAVQMWDWFAEKHPEGEVVGPDAAYLVAEGSGWRGDCDKFCAAMVAAKFLGEVAEGFRVKGWAKWAGYHLAAKEREKTKKARQRQPKGQSPACPGDVPGTSRGQSDIESRGRPGDPSPICESASFASEGVQGEIPNRSPVRARLVSPFAEGQDPFPLTTAILAALWDRGHDSAAPSAKHAGRVEAAIKAATVPVAVERLAVVYAKPGCEKPLTYHVDTIRGQSPPANTKGRAPVGQDFTQEPDWGMSHGKP